MEGRPCLADIGVLVRDVAELEWILFDDAIARKAF